ncbi:MAG: helix-turn-helix transcriptional regulator [Chromatiales bacterium]
MDRTERLYRISSLLGSRRAVPCAEFLKTLEVSHATFKRDLEYLRERFNAPIVWDRELRGYRFADDKSSQAGLRFELPGMWFNASEVHALLAMEHLLEHIQPGLLAPHIAPLRSQVRALLDKGDHAIEEIERRIRLLPIASRAVPTEHFETAARAVLTRKRLRITHHSRVRNETLTREVSPQRLVHYRDNWYLDAWCHMRVALRTFAIDAITHAELLKTNARNVSEKLLDETLGSAYGIFSGKPKHRALLRFTPERARWVSREKWHSQQKSHFDEQGYYLLEIPYSDDRELIMDILKHGPDVEVLKPMTLKARVQQLLEKSLRSFYRESHKG